MSGKPWRLVIDGPLPGASNMGRDMAIAEAVASGEAPPTLRLYRWEPPCLSLGRHQPAEAADMEFCRSHGIDVVRRPTGGRAVLHHEELTYAVIAPVGTEVLPRHLQEAYRTICSGLVAACRIVGIDAALTPGEINLRLPSPTSSVPCFQAPAGGEVAVGGRKIIGSAMRLHDGVVLQHGAWLLDWDGPLQAGAVGLADDGLLRPAITTIAAELGHVPPMEVLEEAVVRGIAGTLGIEIVRGELSRTEVTMANMLAARTRLS